MGFGISSSVAGAKARESQLEILANNIANLQTIGFKELSVAFTSELDKNKIPTDAVSRSQVPVKKGDTYINQLQGGVYRTDSPLDMAIQGDGFFSVQTEDGVRYTRNGNFTINPSGNLVTMSGDTVLSNSGPITIPAGTNVHVGEDGHITAGEDSIGTLLVSNFENQEKMKPQGHNYYDATGLAVKETANNKILQSHLENSNVNLVSNITRIIEVTRAYESLQKTIKQQVEAGKMLNQMAKLG